MTGYGRGEAASRGIKVTLELKSVNHKQFDCRVDLPPFLQAMEIAVREQIHEQVARGGVTCRISMDMSPVLRKQAATVDEALARTYIARLRGAARRLALRDDLGAAALMRLPDVVRFDNPERAVRMSRTLVVRSLKQALRTLRVMRRREGVALRRDITARLGRLHKRVTRIERRAPGVVRHYRQLLLRRIRKSGLNLNAGDPRLLKEVAVYADRADISEELTRLCSHLRQCRAVLADGKLAGRPLDFLVQELFREINTIGSKANDRLIAGEVIQFKAELERMREQAQNIE